MLSDPTERTVPEEKSVMMVQRSDMMRQMKDSRTKQMEDLKRERASQ